ncbi:MAG: hypothetical protein LJE85_14635 [Gammaproteobacteria bacterium]|nr:hypothetical protein [Gammaproteobacteria bacterium]
MIIIKKGLFIISIAVWGVLLSGCELFDNLRQEPETVTTEPVQTAPEPEPATVIESFYEEPSNWRPVLPHELDAHFEESEALLKLMRYSRRIKELTPEELNQEYQAYQAHTKEEKTAVNMQLQHALLLSAAEAPYRDDKRAKTILTKIINSGEKRGLVLREYAYSLLVNIEQREQAEQQYRQLRNILKKEIDRRELLEQKLEALKSIEESITQRQNKTEESAP